MSIIQVSNLTFAYDGSYDQIFENTSFQIDTDWRLGFIGRNGRGKTAFLKLLLGEYEYRGKITASEQFEFPYEISDKSILAINVLEEVYPDLAYWELAREMNLLELDEDVLYRPFEMLSNGEQTKLLLAVLFLKENRFLLIDEPTNHLDIRGRELVSKYLKGKHSFILVSHDRTFLDNAVDHILSINKANIEIQTGNYSSWRMNKNRQDNFEIAKNERLKKDISRLKSASERTSVWSDRVESSKIGAADKGYVGHKAAKMMKRSKSLEARQDKALKEKEKLLKNIEYAEDLKISSISYHSARLLSFRNVGIAYEKNKVFEGLSFEVMRGDRIALSGKNGCGKSSVVKLICGEKIPYTGAFEKGSGLIISYVSQDTSFLRGTLSDYAREKRIDESLFKTILRKMDFSRERFEKDISDFSQGQKKKVLIAGFLCEKAHLYIWDEPLNYIDMDSRMQIENLLLSFSPTMIFVEHDKAFCDAVANKIVDFYK